MDAAGMFGILIGVVGCAIGFLIWFIVRKCKRVQCTVPVQGICRGMIVDYGRGCHFDYLLFDYTYNGVDYKKVKCYDRRREVNLAQESTLEDLGFEEGKEYTIYVDPKKPRMYTVFDHPTK